jgi:hypothetical protein
VNTNDLIERLANELPPVRPLRRPAKRAAVWLLGSILYLGGLAFAVSSFAFEADGMESSLLISQLIGVLAGIVAAIAAFASVVPGYSKRVLLWPAIATFGWFAVFVSTALRGGDWQLVATSQREWACIAIILIGGSPLIAVIATMLRRGAPLNPALTGLLGALAVGLLANFSACISLPHSDGAVTLVWHGGAIVALALVCIVGARFVLTWGSREMHRQ